MYDVKINILLAFNVVMVAAHFFWRQWKRGCWRKTRICWRVLCEQAHYSLQWLYFMLVLLLLHWTVNGGISDLYHAALFCR